MIPTRDQLKEISKLREGSLEETPYPLLLLALAVHESDAVLEIRRPPLEKQIVFSSGSPIECRSNVATETVGRFMVSTGKLSDADFRACLNDSVSRGMPLGEILIERNLVTPSDLSRILQQNLARKLLDVFTWQTGQFRLSHDVPRVDSPLRVKVPQLLVTGLVKFAPQKDIDDAVAPLAGKELVLHPEPHFSLDEIRLSGEQTRLIELLSDGRRFEDLVLEAKLTTEDLNSLLYALTLLGVVTTLDQLPAAPRPTFEMDLSALPARSRHLGQPEVKPVTQPVREINKASQEELTKAYIAHRRKDSFDLLGVLEDASVSVIMRSYLRLAERFAPWHFDEDAPDAPRDKAEELFLAYARAYAELIDTTSRNALLSRRRQARLQVTQAAPTRTVTADRSQVRTDLLDPEAQYEEGKKLFAAGKHREAMMHFAFAADCDSLNGTYAAELAHCRFHMMIASATQALDALKQAMRIDPHCGLAWYYTGKIYATIGNRKEAEANYRKADRMMINDRRPAEALKALASA